MHTYGKEIYDALYNSIENGYAHEFDRHPKEYVLEIYDYSGLTDFDPDDPLDIAVGCLVVRNWRKINWNCNERP